MQLNGGIVQTNEGRTRRAQAPDTDSGMPTRAFLNPPHFPPAFVPKAQSEVKRLLRLIRSGSRTIVSSTNMNQPFVYQNDRDTRSHNHC